MSLFAVMLAEPDDEISQKLKEEFPRNRRYTVSRTSYIVESDLTAGSILDKLEIGRNESDDDTGAIIFSLNGQYSGFYKNSVWEWIEDHSG